MKEIMWVIESDTEQAKLNIVKEPIWEEFESDLFICFYTDTIVPQDAKRILYGKKGGIRWYGKIGNIEKGDGYIRVKMAVGWEGYIIWRKSLELYRDNCVEL